MTIDQLIDGAMRPVADAVSGVVFFTLPLLGADLPLIVLWLVAGGVFFTLYLRFINLRGFAQALRIVSGRYAQAGDPGEISTVQRAQLPRSPARSASATSPARPSQFPPAARGATFWLIVAGLLGMSAKFAECTLGVLYRRRNPDGSVSGGPMHYLELGLGERGWPALGRALGIFYAAAMVLGCLGIGNMFQSNQAAAIFIDITGGDASLFFGRGWLLGLLLAGVVALVIVGGIKSIASTTVRLVPAMALLYVALALLVIGLNAAQLPAAIAAIWQGAFTSTGVAGGALGALVIGFRAPSFPTRRGWAAPPSRTPRRARRKRQARGSSPCSNRSSTPW